MAATIRGCEERDVKQVVALLEKQRHQYERFQPSLWRKAGDSHEACEQAVREMLGLREAFVLVYDSMGAVEGAIFGGIMTAPPIYRPPGPAMLVDEFVVADEAKWRVVGADLVNELANQAKGRGCAHMIVLCVHLDRAKRDFLQACGFATSTEMLVADLTT